MPITTTMILYCILGHHRRRRCTKLLDFHRDHYTIFETLRIIYRLGVISACEGGGLCNIFCFFLYLSRPQGCSNILQNLIHLLVICKSLTVFWATKDLLRSLEILYCRGTHLVCFGNREGHLLELLFQTIYSY